MPLGVTLAMFAIVPAYETHKMYGNPFQLPPSLTHQPTLLRLSPLPPSPSFSGETVARISAECVCYGGPGRIHPVDSVEPFRHPKHSIPFQVRGRWRQGQGEE